MMKLYFNRLISATGGPDYEKIMAGRRDRSGTRPFNLLT